MLKKVRNYEKLSNILEKFKKNTKIEEKLQ